MANKDTIALREMEELTQSIGRAMDDLATKSDRHLDILTNSTDMMKQIVDNLEDAEDLNKAINKLKEKEQDLLKANWGVNEDLKRELLAQVTAAKEALSIEQKRQKVVEQVSRLTSELGEGITDGLDDFKDALEDIPVVGKVLSKIIPMGAIKSGIGNATSAFKNGFATAFTDNLKAGKGFVGSFSSGMTGGMGALSKSLGPLLANPYVLAAAAIAAVVLVGVMGFYKLSEATKAFRKETGLLNSQTKELEGNIINVTRTTAALGASAEDVAKAAAEFTNEFSGLEQPSQAVLSSIVALNKNFGVSTKEAVELNKIFQNIGGLTAEQSQLLVGQTVEMAKMANVAPDKVVKDMAENSEYAYKYFSSSPEKLRDAAVEAAKLGTSLGEAGKVADNLLDFESSITKELEASAMLGQSLNFGRARYLAATKDAVGAQQAVIDEVMKLGDITKLNTFEQDALAGASNMTYESMVNQVRIRERFGKLAGEELAAAEAALAAGKDISKMSEADLKRQTEELAKQQEMQSQFDTMKNQLTAMGTDIMMAMAPIGKLFMAVLVPVFAMLKGYFSGVGTAIERLMSAFDNLLAPFREIFGDSSGEGFLKVMELVGQILARVVVTYISTLARFIDGIANTLGGVFKIIKGIFTLDFSLIGEGIIQSIKGVVEMFLAIPLGMFDAYVDLFDSVLAIFGDIGTKIKATIMNMIPDWVKQLIGVGGFDITSSAQNESMSAAAPSINDGVVQNGQVVSTSPEDFLIATKNPAALANSLGGGGGAMVSMEGVIAELRELKAAFLANKDVYMDSTRVTSIVRRKSETSTDNKFGTQFA